MNSPDVLKSAAKQRRSLVKGKCPTKSAIFKRSIENTGYPNGVPMVTSKNKSVKIIDNVAKVIDN